MLNFKGVKLEIQNFHKLNSIYTIGFKKSFYGYNKSDIQKKFMFKAHCSLFNYLLNQMFWISIK